MLPINSLKTDPDIQFFQLSYINRFLSGKTLPKIQKVRNKNNNQSDVTINTHLLILRLKKVGKCKGTQVATMIYSTKHLKQLQQFYTEVSLASVTFSTSKPILWTSVFPALIQFPAPLRDAKH